uniref:Uncharacterized protein n=1 Tax=Ascaris lumbricoides TaxID=6252 RepID=A0A0M3IXF4_ASCLU
MESLFSLIRLLARVPSLASIIVVWNNAHMNPPPSLKIYYYYYFEFLQC